MFGNFQPKGSSTYVYKCDACGTEARMPDVVKCKACGMSLCSSCNRWSFCPAHAVLLTPAERAAAEKWSRRTRTQPNIFLMMPFACGGMVVMMLSVFLDGILVWGIIGFFTLPLIGFALAFGGGKGRVTKAHYELDKIGHRIAGPAPAQAQAPSAAPPVPLPRHAVAHVQVTCPECGTTHDEDVSYCSYCGASLRPGPPP